MPRRPRCSLAVTALAVLSLFLASAAAAQAPPRGPATAPAASQPHSAPASQPQSAPAASQPGAASRVAPRPDGVAGFGADGAEVWRIRHAGLGASPGAQVVGPLTIAGHTVYAVRADLLEVDVGRGVVVHRTRFPATIAQLAAARDAAATEPRLDVTLRYTGAFPQPASPERVTVPHRLGAPAPGRIFWHAGSWLGAYDDARELAPALKAETADPAAIPPEAREQTIAALRAAAARDLTNPHYHALLGVLLAGAGQSTDATHAFAAAADLPGAHWADLLRVASTLEDAGAREPARRAFARGVRAFEAAGIRPARLRTAIGMMTLMPPPRRALTAAFKAKDPARVDEIAARTARVFPHGEGAAYAWARLAGWLREQGQADRGARWEERARHGGTVFAADPRRDLAAEVDARIPFLFGALIGAVLIAFVRGLRRGGASRGQEGGLARVPLPGALDLAVILLPLLAALAIDLGTADRIAALGRYGSAPTALFNDAADAPDVERWIAARLEPGPARNVLQAFAVEEAQATRAGRRAETPPLDVATYHEAIEHSGTLSARLTRSLGGSLAALVAAVKPGKPGALGAIRGLGTVAVAALALFVLGFLLGRVVPLLQALSWLIPGGAKALSLPGGLITALAAAGVCGNYFPAALSKLAVPNFFKLYGFEAIASADAGLPTTAPAWVFVALAVALGLHVWGITRDLKRRPAPPE